MKTCARALLLLLTIAVCVSASNPNSEEPGSNSSSFGWKTVERSSKFVTAATLQNIDTGSPG